MHHLIQLTRPNEVCSWDRFVKFACYATFLQNILTLRYQTTVRQYHYLRCVCVILMGKTLPTRNAPYQIDFSVNIEWVIGYTFLCTKLDANFSIQPESIISSRTLRSNYLNIKDLLNFAERTRVMKIYLIHSRDV